MEKVKMMYLLKVFLLVSILYNCQSDSGDLVVNNGNGDLTIVKVTSLPSEVDETSGLINFDGRIITHNDSSGEPSLYELNTETGEVMRKVTISDIENIDMEDIAQDDDYIYLCDIGNNSNTRDNQAIYKISKADYLIKDEVTAQKISISYQEQTDFTRTNKETNFDAEAVVNIDDALFLFTKNWGDNQTAVYRIPKEAGVYSLSKIDSFDIKGLITGADYNAETQTVLLTGYLDFNTFVVSLTNFSKSNPLGGRIEKTSINVSGSIQIEGVAANPDGSYYLSAEAVSGFSAILYKLTFQ